MGGGCVTLIPEIKADLNLMYIYCRFFLDIIYINYSTIDLGFRKSSVTVLLNYERPLLGLEPKQRARAGEFESFDEMEW